MFIRKIGKRIEDDGIREVNMTPLIDVSLVLVVILLLATPLAFESTIAVRKSAATARAAEKDVDGRIELRVVSDDSVRVNRTLIARDNVAAHVKPLIDEAPTRLVVLSCADAVSHGAFVDVLDQAKMSGASDIAVTGR